MRNMNKFMAVAQIKWIGITRNPVIMTGPIFTVAMVYVFKIIYGMAFDGELTPGIMSSLLNLGLTMNVCGDGFMMVGTAIAEEKEKHTLRALMTSSVTGWQYFLGSIFFPFIITVLINFAVLIISGVPMARVFIPGFFAVSVMASLISCVIGMIVGICAKNQMSASLVGTPLMMVFMMIPLFGSMSEGLHKLSGFLFTGVLSEMAGSYATEAGYTIMPLDIAVLIGGFVISVLVFLILYRKNGYEND